MILGQKPTMPKALVIRRRWLHQWFFNFYISNRSPNFI